MDDPAEGAAGMTLFEELGGEPALRAIIERFVDVMFDDVMIGFHFRDASRERIKAKEYEFAASHLGAEIEYTGRPLPEAHASHPILDGQFARRTKILEVTLEEHDAPARVREHWLARTENLRGSILRERDPDCDQALRRLSGLPAPRALPSKPEGQS
jgi:hemoglobin